MTEIERAQTAERFHIGDLLSITTGRLLSPDHMGGIYRICDFVTDQAHMTHQLGRAADAVKPWLLEQHPWLADVQAPEDLEGESDVIAWLAHVAAEHGEYHDVESMPFGMYVGREPIAELREMAPHVQIIGVETDRG